MLTDLRPDVQAKADRFIQNIKPVFQSVEHIVPGSDYEFDDRTLLVVFHRVRGYIDAATSGQTIQGTIRVIAEKLSNRGNTLAGLVLFGNPYLDRAFLPAPKFILKTFSESSASIEMASKRLIASYNAQ
jgi:hypothetical protein